MPEGVGRYGEEERDYGGAWDVAEPTRNWYSKSASISLIYW
jgi:hypothetical protein